MTGISCSKTTTRVHSPWLSVCVPW